METVLYLGHGIQPTMPLPPASAKKLCFSSRRSSSLPLSSGHKKTLRGRVIECSDKEKQETVASFNSPATRLGALKSLFDMMTCLRSHDQSYSTPKSNSQEPTLDSGDKSDHSIKEFKKKVALRMGHEKAFERLKEEYEKYHEKDFNIGFQLDIALVEILIYQRKFEEALKRKCFEESPHSDLRCKLYKAMIHTMLALSFWQEFWFPQDTNIPDPMKESDCDD